MLVVDPELTQPGHPIARGPGGKTLTYAALGVGATGAVLFIVFIVYLASLNSTACLTIDRQIKGSSAVSRIDYYPPSATDMTSVNFAVELPMCRAKISLAFDPPRDFTTVKVAVEHPTYPLSTFLGFKGSMNTSGVDTRYYRVAAVVTTAVTVRFPNCVSSPVAKLNVSVVVATADPPTRFTLEYITSFDTFTGKPRLHEHYQTTKTIFQPFLPANEYKPRRPVIGWRPLTS